MPFTSIVVEGVPLGFLLMMFTKPPGWTWPYSTDIGPFTTSMWSTPTVGGEPKRPVRPGRPSTMIAFLSSLPVLKPRMVRS